jgi:PiT family inorganic phosphate transporter
MNVFLFISSALFLGWTLGSNQAGNILGTLVDTKTLKFSLAAIGSAIFVILGALVIGENGTEILHKLGSIDTMGGAFTVALCSGLTVFALTYYKFPTSTTQSVVGGILGWCFFTKTTIDYSALSVILTSWLAGPIIGALLAPVFYLLLRNFLRKSRVHIIKMDFYLRLVLILLGAFFSFSLGANNLANVVGPFSLAIPDLDINFGFYSFSSTQLLFLLGGVSIAAGIYTSRRRISDNRFNELMELTPETAIVVILSTTLILFVFSSILISRFFISIGLPYLPQVPLSSSQIIAGSILGVSLIKGVSEVRFKILGQMATGWLLSPLISFAGTFFSLFIVQNVFKISVTNVTATAEISQSSFAGTTYKTISVPASGNLTLMIISLFILALLLLFVFFQLRKYQINSMAIQDERMQAYQYNELHRALTDIEVKTVQLENNALAIRLQEKRDEVVNFALSIGEQRKFLETLASKAEKALSEEDVSKRSEILKEVLTILHQKMSFSNEMDDLYLKAEEIHQDFPQKVKERFPDLTEQEKRLTILLRVGFSSKEISSIMNISPKSVEISRYRLRKKLNINNKINLTQFIKDI